MGAEVGLTHTYETLLKSSNDACFQEIIENSEIPTQILETPETANQDNLYSEEIDSEAPTQIHQLNHDTEEETLNVLEEGVGKYLDRYY